VGGRKLPFPTHYFGHWLIQQLVLLYKPWWYYLTQIVVGEVWQHPVIECAVRFAVSSITCYIFCDSDCWMQVCIVKVAQCLTRYRCNWCQHKWVYASDVIKFTYWIFGSICRIISISYRVLWICHWWGRNLKKDCTTIRGSLLMICGLYSTMHGCTIAKHLKCTSFAQRWVINFFHCFLVYAARCFHVCVINREWDW